MDDVYAEGDEVFRVSVSGIVDSDSNPIFEALNLDNAFVDTTISDETDPGPEDTVTVTMTGPANVVEGDTTTEYTVTLSDQRQWVASSRLLIATPRHPVTTSLKPPKRDYWGGWCDRHVYH